MSQSDRDRLGITEVSLPTAERIAELREHAACVAIWDRVSAQLDEAYRKIGEVTARADKAERDLAEAVGLLRDTMWTEIGIDSECTSCGATISAGHFKTCELRAFLAKQGGTP